MTSPRRSLTRTLAEIAHVLESPQDVETRLRTVLELLKDLVPYDYCTLLRTRDDRVHQLTMCPDVDQAEQARVRAELERLLHLVQESPLADSDAAALGWSDQQHNQDQRAPEWQNRLAVPLVGLDRVIGLLAVGRRAPYAYGEEDVSLLAIVAAQLAAYVAALSAEARSKEGLQLLAAAGTLLGESFNVSERLQRIADLAVPALGDRCTAAVADDSGAIMFRAVASALPATEEARIWELTERYPLRATASGAAEYALLTSHAQVIAHIREQVNRSAASDDESFEALRGLPFTSLISVPLMARGKTLGTIEFLRTGARSPYGPGDVPLAQELARRAALALDNARLYQDAVEARASAEQAVERLTLLQRARAGLAGAMTMTSVADVIATQSMASLGANGAVVSVLSDDGASFTNLRIAGYPVQAMAAWREYRTGASTPLGDAAHERDLVIVDSPQASTVRSPAGIAATLSGGTASGVAIPLLLGERVIGGLELSFADARSFSAEEQQFMQALGGLCAQALERARLYEAEQRARELLAARTLQGQEEERARIARELHDGTAQSLSILMIHLDRLKKRLPAQDDSVQSEFEQVRGLAQRSLDEIRSLAHDLRPSILDDVGLVAALHWFGEECERSFGLKVDIDAEPPPREGLSPQMETAFFRIAQEALRNSAKHAGVCKASIMLSFRGGAAKLVVEDDGHGFDLGQVTRGADRRGLGLDGMKERALLLGGTCAVDTQPGKGTRITVVAPLQAQTADAGLATGQ
ncbi:MAG TPA: GAF domain-containing protein [Chloroflexota bacterium]|nr:GAF domain-containing protein [Chloroflexota bacterium]